ncbi:MAG: YciI family protein [Pseudomonadota bacterium]|nr:YciI family protein [Pseudomonadota bacterium]
MKVMLLAYESPGDFDTREDKAKFGPYLNAWMTFADSMRESGVYLSGSALRGPETATLISVENGRRSVQDGPFADAKEQLGGFVIIDAPDMASAVEWAAKCPAAASGRVEVRPIPNYGEE